MRSTSIIAVICLATSALGVYVVNNNAWVSPCPKLFDYNIASNTKGTWYGTITLLRDTDVNGIWLRILLDQPSLLLDNDFGEAGKREDNVYLIKNRHFTLKANMPKVINIVVTYDPNGTTPQLVGMVLNSRTICPEFTIEGPTTTTRISTSSDASTSSTESSNIHHTTKPPERIPTSTSGITAKESEVSDRGCGNPQSVKAAPLILGGHASTEGEWPWHAAIYRNDDGTLGYICGGSVVSRKIIVTAAHCVIDLASGHKIAAINFLVYAGTTNLRTLSLNTQTIQIAEIHIHPQFMRDKFVHDIALLEARKPMEYDNYVKPVCLWQGSDELREVVNELGTVVGWGLTETEKFSKVLKKIRLPIISTDDCIFSKPTFFSQFLNPTKFCAGYKNGTAPCNGDSGSGMVLSRPNSNGENIWFLRGVVSVGKPVAPGKRICDPYEYVVFTDASKYVPWIQSIIQK